MVKLSSQAFYGGEGRKYGGTQRNWPSIAHKIDIIAFEFHISELVLL